MESPGTFHSLGARRAAGLAINAAQIPYVLRRNSELPNHGSELVLELGGVGKLLPLQSSAEQIEAVLIGRFRDFQAVARSPVDRSKRRAQLRRQRQSHADGLTFGSRKFLQMLLGEA